MQNNFENSIKNKVEKFDGMPPEKAWVGISQKIKNNTMENKSNNQSRKIWIGAAATVALILAVLFWKLNATETEKTPAPTQSPIAQRVASESTGTTASEMFPTELEMAKQQGKGVMAYVCMENCKFCAKFVNETLSRPEVHEYLENRFIQVAVDLRDKNNHPFFKAHEINAAPCAMFFGPDGKFLTISKGAIPTEDFMEIAEEAWSAFSGESSLSSSMKKLPEVKIFPNPNNGDFNIQLTAANAPVFLKILDESGREVHQEKQDNFSGYYNGKIDLTAFPKGVYYLKIIQEKQMVTEKIMVQ